MPYSTSGLPLTNSSTPQTFFPSRRLPSSCFNDSWSHQVDACFYDGNTTSDPSDEWTNILANISDENQILSVHEGSLILPAESDPDIDYYASTFGSTTSCSIATNLRDIHTVVDSTYVGTSTLNSNDQDGYNDIFVNCSVDQAGFNLRASFSDLILVQGVDVIEPTVDAIYFTDATMSQTKGSQPYGSTWWSAVPFTIGSRYVSNTTTYNELVNSSNSINVTFSSEENPYSKKDMTLISKPLTPVFGLVPVLNYSSYLIAGGILSCVTNLSDVVRTMLRSLWFICAAALTIYVRRLIWPPVEPSPTAIGPR